MTMRYFYALYATSPSMDTLSPSLSFSSSISLSKNTPSQISIIKFSPAFIGREEAVLSFSLCLYFGGAITAQTKTAKVNIPHKNIPKTKFPKSFSQNEFSQLFFSPSLSSFLLFLLSYFFLLSLLSCSPLFINTTFFFSLVPGMRIGRSISGRTAATHCRIARRMTRWA
jgi:hypothetical protein